MAVGQKQWYHLGVGAPPILEPILVGIGMFTGGTIWILTHGHFFTSSPFQSLRLDSHFGSGAPQALLLLFAYAREPKARSKSALPVPAECGSFGFLGGSQPSGSLAFLPFGV